MRPKFGSLGQEDPLEKEMATVSLGWQLSAVYLVWSCLH